MKKSQVEQNYEAFIEHLPSLAMHYSGKFALMHNKEIVGFLDTAGDAHWIGIRLYGDGKFSIQEVTDVPVYCIQARGMNWNKIKADLFEDYPICQYCKKQDAHQLAHAIVHKRYKPGSKNYKFVNVRYNALPCCVPCQPFSETYEGRRHAWKKLGEREGEKVMRIWYDDLELKIKETFQ